ncbi:unnamed protein product [Trichogramma brassicae]|uniref:Uncharacterized protein n=1 Tax=Trichogramma brassicae TaxID=86971 RepID=A0A6H5J358_9HYME|nr:unnamed protein product [Trichogramma brassicae]
MYYNIPKARQDRFDVNYIDESGLGNQEKDISKQVEEEFITVRHLCKIYDRFDVNYTDKSNIYSETVRHLFKIYDRFDVNYTNEFGFMYFHETCTIQTVVYTYYQLTIFLMVPREISGYTTIGKTNGNSKPEKFRKNGLKVHSGEKRPFGKMALQAIRGIKEVIRKSYFVGHSGKRIRKMFKVVYRMITIDFNIQYVFNMFYSIIQLMIKNTFYRYQHFSRDNEKRIKQLQPEQEQWRLRMQQENEELRRQINALRQQLENHRDRPQAHGGNRDVQRRRAGVQVRERQEVRRLAVFAAELYRNSRPASRGRGGGGDRGKRGGRGKYSRREGACDSRHVNSRERRAAEPAGADVGREARRAEADGAWAAPDAANVSVHNGEGDYGENNCRSLALQGKGCQAPVSPRKFATGTLEDKLERLDGLIRGLGQFIQGKSNLHKEVISYQVSLGMALSALRKSLESQVPPRPPAADKAVCTSPLFTGSATSKRLATPPLASHATPKRHAVTPASKQHDENNNEVGDQDGFVLVDRRRHRQRKQTAATPGAVHARQ